MSLGGTSAKISTGGVRRPKPPVQPPPKSETASLVSRLNSNKLLPVETIELELFGPIASADTGIGGSSSPLPSLPPSPSANRALGGGGKNKAALQKLASSFAALNKRKAEKRNRDHTAWKSLIQNALDLQKGKIPLLLAVEAGNQSMCRELLSSQTVDQLKVCVFRICVFFMRVCWVWCLLLLEVRF